VVSLPTPDLGAGLRILRGASPVDVHNVAAMTWCQHPLAYVLGLEGIALMRSFTGEHEREFIDSRIAEIRRLLDDESLADVVVEVAGVDTVEGYRIWSETYDGPNSAFDFDEPVIHDFVSTLPAGVALDAACGTGRIAAVLAGHGHRVVGVDSSPDMLARARRRVPQGEFRLGDLHRLPVDDDAVDLIVCSLALTHVPQLGPVLAEFARVLRPGGQLLISDMHPERVARGVIPPVHRADGKPGRVTSYQHRPGDYLRAALPVGLQVRSCEEPGASSVYGTRSTDAPRMPYGERTTDTGPWEMWPYSLADLVPDAAAAAHAGVPVMLLWRFELVRPAAATRR
jgi:ubiquinone/menaquinone biosynthesis C-methylase UbiE